MVRKTCHLCGERSFQKKLRKGSSPHLSTKRPSNESKGGDDPGNSDRKGKAKSSSGEQKSASRPRRKSGQDQTELAGNEDGWPLNKRQEPPATKLASGTGAPKTKASQNKVAKAPAKTDTDGQKTSNKKTHPSGAELPRASLKTKQSNGAEPPRKSATHTRKVSRKESVGATGGDKSSRPKDVDRRDAADETYRDDSNSRSNTKRSKQREKNEKSDADVAKRKGDVPRDEAKKSPNLTKRTKSLGSSPSSPLRSQRKQVSEKQVLDGAKISRSPGAKDEVSNTSTERIKNSVRRKQPQPPFRKSAVEEGLSATTETQHEPAGDSKANHGSKPLRHPGQDDHLRKTRSKEKDQALRRKKSAEDKPREPQRASRASDKAHKPPKRDDKVAKSNKTETTRKDNTESVQNNRGRSRHTDKPPKGTKDDKQAVNKKSRNVRMARSASPEKRRKGGAETGEERRNLNERIKRSKSVPPQRQRVDPQHHCNLNEGTKIPSTFSVYRNEFLDTLANMSVFQTTVVGGTARLPNQPNPVKPTSDIPLPLKKEKNRHS